MTGTVNRALIIGHLGKDPDLRTFANGGRVASFSVATTDTWKNQAGERQGKTQWHSINVMSDALAEITGKYLHKGSYVCIEGSFETRSFDKDGEKRYVTEIVIRPFSGNLTLLDRKPADDPADRPAQRQRRGAQPGPRQ